MSIGLLKRPEICRLEQLMFEPSPRVHQSGEDQPDGALVGVEVSSKSRLVLGNGNRTSVMLNDPAPALIMTGRPVSREVLSPTAKICR